jgi:hypothetical protein
VVEKKDAHVDAVAAVVYVHVVVALNDVVAVLFAELPVEYVAVVDCVVIYEIHEMPS